MKTKHETQRVKQELKQMIDEGVICGASAAFVTGEEAETWYYGAMGRIAPYDSRPVTAGLYYDLASLSKVVGTTSRAMQLIQEGEFGLDTPVDRLLPGFPWKDITAGNLLLHNSGLPAEIADKYTLTKENILERLYKTAPETAPGQRFVYSDVGFILLGLVISRGNGLKEQGTLEEIYRNHVFGPLGMEHTTFVTAGKEDLCLPTEKTEKRGLICGQTHDFKAWLLGQSGSAGLFSTLDDLVKFVRAYLNRSEKLFSEATYGLIYGTDENGRTYGWSKEYGEEHLYHTGFAGTSILIDGNAGEAMVLLTNRIHPDRNNQAFLEKRKELNRIWLDFS